jgi:mannitol/fructose-specific phosphotransferase system IIA component (Ntr-type)
MTDLITEALVVLDLKAAEKSDATRQLAERMQAAGRVTDLEGCLADVAASKAQKATGMPGGIGLAHARSEHVTTPSLGLARVPNGVDFGGPEPATLVFLIAAPAGGGLRAVHPGGADPPAGAPRVPPDHHRRPRRRVDRFLRPRSGGTAI